MIGLSEEIPAPLVHLARTPARPTVMKTASRWKASLRLRWLSSDIVDGLAQRVFAVEHPAVGARKQRIGHVPDAALDRTARLGAGPGTLNPLTLQVVRNLRAIELAITSVLDRDFGPGIVAAGSRKRICSEFSLRLRRRSIRTSINSRRSRLNGASAASASSASFVNTSGYSSRTSLVILRSKAGLLSCFRPAA